MKKVIQCIFILLLATSCSMKRQPIMTISGYQSTHIGMARENLVRNFGEPQTVTTLDSGIIIYEYEERFMTGAQMLQVRRYVFYIKDDRVVSKQMKIYDRPGYEGMSDLPNDLN
jgi:hypothetical protein